MITLYYYNKYRLDEGLKTREAVRETKEFWVFPMPVSRYNPKGEIRESKHKYNPAWEYHLTAKEAVETFLTYAEGQKAEALISLAKWTKLADETQKALANIKDI